MVSNGCILQMVEKKVSVADGLVSKGSQDQEV